MKRLNLGCGNDYLEDFYVRFFAFIIPCSEIKYKLQVIK